MTFGPQASNIIRAQENRIRELEAERDEWQQVASVEADLRREFKERAEKAEAAIKGVEGKEMKGRTLKVNEARHRVKAGAE